jgi:hypothetical protein
MSHRPAIGIDDPIIHRGLAQIAMGDGAAA